MSLVVARDVIRNLYVDCEKHQRERNWCPISDKETGKVKFVYVTYTEMTSARRTQVLENVKIRLVSGAI